MKKPKVLKVKVGKLQIESGYAGSPDYCPIGLALRGLGLFDVSVGSDVEFTDPDTDFPVRLKSPKCIMRFIDRFDNHKSVEPFEFEIKLPVVIPGRIRC